MDCLLNYIGLQGCGSTIPDSGLYVNDLAGIQLRQVNEIANEDQQNYTGVWDKIQRRSLKIFEKDVRVAFRQKYRIKGVTQSLNIGRLIDTAITKSQSAEYRGLTVELNQETDNWVDSNFQVINIQKINIYVPGAETFDVKIYDLDTEEELFTKEVTTTAAGWTAVNVNDYFLSSRRIFIAYDCTGIDSVKLDLDDHNLDHIGDCQARVRGACSTTGDPSNITVDTNNSHGLSVIFSVQCKYDVVVCNNKEVFAQSLLYLLGSQLMFEQLNSSAVNRWTMLDNERAKFLHGYYKAMYEGGIFTDGDQEHEFSGELNDAIEIINLDSADCCLDCIGPLSFQDAYI